MTFPSISGFNRRDICLTMDVWTADNAYLGTVRRVSAGVVTLGARVDSPPVGKSEFSGEALGPAPTQSVGNRGPIVQAARAAYATSADGAEPLGTGSMTVGHWAGLMGRRTIPLDLVQSVSLERVTLKTTRAELEQPRRR